MADQSTQSIVIDAAPAEIMAVITDFPRYPEWTGAVKSVEILDTNEHGQANQVRFTLDAGAVKDEYILAYTYGNDGLTLSWQLVKGQMQKAQRGEYRLAAEENSTVVTYSLAVELVIPMIGLFKRKAEKVIMNTALKDLKRRVEGND